MRAELLELAADLARRGEPFVLATVVRRESYSSAHQGDMAVITADGAYHGWLGGNCTQPIVKSEAARALVDGQPRLVSLSPQPDRELRPGVVALPMRCHSGGTVDIYLEPVLPAPRLLLYGESPAARALAQLGKAMGYRVEAAGSGAPAPARGTEHLFAVVATMCERDEDSVASALAARPAYLAVVASRKRFAQLRETLLARGVPKETLDGIKNPAGLDIGARLPEEVALSILAEIVQLRRAQADALAPEPVPAALWGFLTDPQRVARWMPGAAITDRIDEKTFAGTMAVKVGPVSTSYKGKVVFEKLDASAHTAEIVATGQDIRGRGGADLRLTSSVRELSPGETEVTAASKVNITGILAQMGRGMVQDVSDQLFQVFSQRMRAELEPGQNLVSAPAPAAAVPAAAAPAPSAVQVAAAAGPGTAPPVALYLLFR